MDLSRKIKTPVMSGPSVGEEAAARVRRVPMLELVEAIRDATGPSRWPPPSPPRCVPGGGVRTRTQTQIRNRDRDRDRIAFG